MPTNDPTVTSKTTASPSPGAHESRPINKADDYTGDRKYEDAPDKPAPETVAQHEVPPTSGTFAKKDS